MMNGVELTVDEPVVSTEARGGMGPGAIIARIVIAAVGLSIGAVLGFIAALMSGLINFAC